MAKVIQEVSECDICGNAMDSEEIVFDIRYKSKRFKYVDVHTACAPDWLDNLLKSLSPVDSVEDSGKDSKPVKNAK